MTRKRRRLLIVVIAMLGLGTATALVLTALQDNMEFFKTPSSLASDPVAQGRRFRLGGLVEEHSVEKQADGVTIKFRVTDLKSTMNVTYKGVLPDLFREGQGVVATGHLDQSGFVATEILARHDEKYMPPDVAAGLKKAGVWQGDGATYKPPVADQKAANP